MGPIVKKVVEGKPTSFYHLVVLDDGGGELFVPVDKVHHTGIRQLLAKSEIPKLLGQLRRAAKIAKPRTARNWKQQAVDKLKLFTSGSDFDLVKVIESLNDLSGTRALTPGEKSTLERARKLLIGEISEVMGESKSVIAEQLDQALKTRHSQE
jgi:RNA polymerase-interacting CarD/CdnL/TRCF family regulator